MEIRTEDTTLSYGAARILKGISLETHTGEFVGIIGPNGSGKSTLLKCIYRVLKPDGGCIWLGDQELHEMKIRNLPERWRSSPSIIIIILNFPSAKW